MRKITSEYVFVVVVSIWKEKDNEIEFVNN